VIFDADSPEGGACLGHDPSLAKFKFADRH
jgi:hypothetical protein